jgi:DNA helicase-2/ATP-dependent DNA helicase PcrA
LFVKKEDPAIKFFAETVEPMCAAYGGSRYGDMFRVFGSGPAIVKHADKSSWRENMDTLQKLRAEGTIGEVIEHLKTTRRPSLPDRLLRRDEELRALNGDPVPEDASALQRYSKLRNVRYKEVIEVVKFIDRQTPFATQHSVKGAEFENVLVVLGGGWNHYNWPQLLELVQTKALNAKNTKGYYRARNLFYVSISRPMTRLAVLATQTMSETALAAVNGLFGNDNVEELVIPT